ncbi:MAG: PBP1A family penicillin-binding protein [Myxococcota bacterium]|nr:PBP1A family penicillin-binding protein [Myxococcota bacterium]
MDQFKKRIKVALVLTTLTISATLIALISLFNELPKIDTIDDYEPTQGTKVFAKNGELIAHFATQRRTVVQIDSLPKYVIHAFLAAEDSSFYDHPGLDLVGITRAFVKNLRPGARLQGASTITQQLVKTLLVGDERSYTRKLKEAFLSLKLEQRLTKDEILHIYLNQIYFGSGVYGIEEAAQTYFGKHARNLTIPEAAFIASAPKSPNRYNLLKDVKAVKNRQLYVLKEMVKNGWADQALFHKEEKEAPPTPLSSRLFLGKAPTYSDWILKQLLSKYDRENIFENGFKVFSSIDLPLQLAAQTALDDGLEKLAKQHGYPGPMGRIEIDVFNEVIQMAQKSLDSFLRKRKIEPHSPRADNYVFDFAKIARTTKHVDSRSIQSLKIRVLKKGLRITCPIIGIDDAAKSFSVSIGHHKILLSTTDIPWLRKFSPETPTPLVVIPSRILEIGDLVRIEVLPFNDTKSLRAKLIPIPKAQGAVVAIDPHRREVRAVVGGYDFHAGDFNRALNAKRQPGSALKPMIYAAALHQRIISPRSMCQDAPVVIRDPWTGKTWKPQNYQDGKFDGNISYRDALAKSKNTCAIKLLERVGLSKSLEMIQKVGIRSTQPSNLTLALGTGEVSPLEIVNAYATFASGGLNESPVLIRKIVKYNGDITYEHKMTSQLAIPPELAFMVTNMLESVVQNGTAQKAKKLNRPLAGKTGTTNGPKDAWFVGYSSNLVAGVWIGFDNNMNLGRATGSSTALPIWVDFFEKTLKNYPAHPFETPEGITTVAAAGATETIPGESVEKYVVPSAYFTDTPIADPAENRQSIFIEDMENDEEIP